MAAAPLPSPYQWTADICQTCLGRICQAIDTTNGAEVTIKVVDFSKFSQDEANAVAHEARVLMYLKHDHVVETYNVVIDPDSSTLFIVMEPCLGTLGTAIQIMGGSGRAIPEEYLWYMAAEIGSALKYLHEPHEKMMIDWYNSEIPVGSVVHGYLTPSDIYVSRDGRCKIGGISPTQSAWEIRSGNAELGRLFLQAPEILELQATITEKVDIWSLGTTLFFMASFRPVWVSADYPSVLNEIMYGRTQRVPDQYSQEFDDFITKCLQRDPMYRPSILELLLEPRIEEAMHAVRDRTVPSMLYLVGAAAEPQEQAASAAATKEPEFPQEPQGEPMDDEQYVPKLVSEADPTDSLNPPEMPTDMPVAAASVAIEPGTMATYAPPEASTVVTADALVDDQGCINAAEQIVHVIAIEACAVPPVTEDEQELVDMNILPASVTASVQEVPAEQYAAPMEERIASAIEQTTAEVQGTYKPADGDLVACDSVHRLEENPDEYEPPLPDFVDTLPDPVDREEPDYQPDAAVVAVATVATAPVYEEVSKPISYPEPEPVEKYVAPVTVAAYPQPVQEAVPIVARQPTYQYHYHGEPVAKAAEGVTGLMESVSRKDIDAARGLLYEAGQADSLGKTALMRAAELGCAPLVALLVDYEHGRRDIDGWTALMFAVHSRCPECVRILAPYEKCMRLSNGHTALIMAAFWDNSEAVSELAQYEARLSTTDMYFEGEGFTALMEAARWGRYNIVQILAPYEKDLCDSRGMRALDYALASTDSVRHENKERCVALLSE